MNETRRIRRWSARAPWALVAALSLPATAAEPSSEVGLFATQFELDVITTAAPSGSASFPVEPGAAIRVDVESRVAGLVVNLVGPGGQAVNPGTIAGFGGEYLEVPGFGGDSPLLPPSSSSSFHHVYELPSLGGGTLTVSFAAPAGFVGEAAVVTTLLLDSPVRTALLVTQPELQLGDAAVLVAPIFDGSTPVAGAVVTVPIRRQGAELATISLQDDGQGADSMAGDGLYSGEFVPALEGAHVATATVTGLSAAGPFRREAAAGFDVMAASARLTGGADDEGADDNSDGLFDRVVLDVGVNASAAGTYRAFVRLRSPSGVETVGSADATLPAGPAEIPVSFPAEELLALGGEGPFDIPMLDLFHVRAADVVLVDQFPDAGQTEAYTRSQLQRPPITLTGVVSDAGRDDDANGLFDRLETTLQVDLAHAGFYSWGLKVTDSTGRELDFASGSGSLPAGLADLVVDFEGVPLGDGEVDGPWELRDLLVSGPPGASLVAGRAGSTGAWQSEQFESSRQVTANAGEALAVPCPLEKQGAVVTLDGTQSADSRGAPLTYAWSASGIAFDDATSATPTATFPEGATLVTLAVSNGAQVAQDTVLVTVGECCRGGDIHPDGAGNEVVGLADFVLAVRKSTGTTPLNAHDMTCGDVFPGALACPSGGGFRAFAGWCAAGDGAFGQGDVVTILRLALRFWRVACEACATAPGPAPGEQRLAGDIAPAGGGDGRVDVADVVRALRLAVRLDAADRETSLRADVAPARFEGGDAIALGDGQVTIADVVLLLRASVSQARLDWPVREIVVRLESDTPRVAFAASVAGWPVGCRQAGFDAAGCGEAVPGGLLVEGDAWALACSTDPAEIDGAADLATFRYRAPEPVDPASLTLEHEILGADLEARAADVRLVAR